MVVSPDATHVADRIAREPDVLATIVREGLDSVGAGIASVGGAIEGWPEQITAALWQISTTLEQWSPGAGDGEPVDLARFFGIGGEFHIEQGDNLGDHANRLLRGWRKMLGEMFGTRSPDIGFLRDALMFPITTAMGGQAPTDAKGQPRSLSQRADAAIRPAEDAGPAHAKKYTDQFAEMLAGLLMGKPRVGDAVPAKAETRAGEWAMRAVGYGFLAHAVSALASGKFAGSGFDFRFIAAFLAEAGSFSRISAGYINEWYGQTVGEPLHYHAAWHCQPQQPGTMDVTRWTYKRIIRRQMFDTLMRYQGWNQGHRDRWWNDLFTEPRLMDLRYMLGGPEWTDAWLHDKAIRLGYTDEDAKILEQGLRVFNVSRERQGVAVQLIAMYTNRLMSRDGMLQELTALGYRAEQAKLVADEAAYRRIILDYKSSVAMATEKLNRGVITPEEFTVELAEFRLSPVTLRRMAAMARLRLMPRVKYWPANWTKVQYTTELRSRTGEIRNHVRAGRMTIEQAEGMLLESGYSDEAVDLMLQGWEQDRAATVAAEYRRFGLPAIEDQYVAEKIGDAELTEALLRAGAPDGLINLWLEHCKAVLADRRARRVRRESLAVYVRGYKAGLVGPDRLRQLFIDAGYSEQTARLAVLVYRELARLKAAREARANTVPLLMRAYLGGLIGNTELREGMVDAAMKPRLVDLAMRLAMARRDYESTRYIRREMLPTIRRGYREGWLEDADLLSMMRSAGIPEAVAEMQLRLERIKRDKALGVGTDPADVDALWQAYIAGDLPREDLAAALEAAGLADDELAAALAAAELLRARAAGEPVTPETVDAWQAGYAAGWISGGELADALEAAGLTPEKIEEALDTLGGL